MLMLVDDFNYERNVYKFKTLKEALDKFDWLILSEATFTVPYDPEDNFFLPGTIYNIDSYTFQFIVNEEPKKIVPVRKIMTFELEP